MIEVLGSYGNRGKNKFTTSFLIKDNIVIDAGNLTNGIENIVNIEHILLTHSHFDHIIDIPFVIDTDFIKRDKTLKIYGLKETIIALKDIFNNKIWPDFSKINLLNGKKAIEFIEIEKYKSFYIEDILIEPIHAEHTIPTIGFKITKNNNSIIITGDTYKNDRLLEDIKNTTNLKALFIECSFPSNLESLAKETKHLTPKLIYDMNINVPMFFYHFKYEYKSQIIAELSSFEILTKANQILEDGSCINVFDSRCVIHKKDLYNDKLKKLAKIGLDLSKQTNIDYLLDDILNVAMLLTNADAGSIYLKQDNKLCFQIVKNKTLNIYMGGKFDKIKWEPLELYIDNKPNKKMVAVLSALEQKIYNIPDIYKDTQFDFSGAKKFDKQTGYLSKSMIVIPLVDYQNETIGVLQLLNKKDKDFVIPFNEEDEEISLSLASEAAVYITKNKLIQDLENFIESFIRVIANAVDEKSKYTGHHVQKVAILAEIISKEISKDKDFFPDVTYDERMLKQIKIAALLHDIGKITTNPTIMDKATKLQAVVDRIEIIKERFEIIKRDLLLKGINDFSELKKDFEILKLANIGSEFMSDEKIKQIEQIAKKYTYYLDDKKVNILRDDELEMLKIQKGTLSKEEREHIQRHALMTYEMLNALPFPKEYSEVTHIASNHHEKLNGKGYARKLSEKDLSLEDKLLVICDIFEALTASDRPYKEAKKLSEVFKIMEYMVKDKEIDEKLYRFFKEKEIWKKYLDYISPEQIDI